ncbi:MAG TPA: nodulation protein NfeD [Gaiellaceae bacterium]|jgi:membrane-bound serine protease (ClpP class)|nr:nodulation protein NfeD [Gaiellaceae bacterium]
MRPKLACVFGVAAILAIAVPGAGSVPAASTPRVLAIHFVQDVNPVTQSWLNHQLDRAHSDHYAAAVIVLDTPGGLEESERKIVQKELQVSAEGTPVIVYVSPNGARAASAGVWISEAADVLAMAPETNIGSSTPIDGSGSNIGSDLRRKIINDAAASLRGLATTHKRNAAWADKAVRVASNLTAAEALKLHVIDTTAPTLPALLDKIDGETTVPAGLTLHTANAEIVDDNPGFVTRFLSTILDPNLLSLLFLAGIAGIAFEIFHPGIVLPGALGAVSMLLALFGLAILPISWTSAGLVVLGILLLVVDTQVPTHGALTVAGLVSLGFGLATLVNDSSGTYTTSTVLVVTLTLVLGGLFAWVTSKVLAIRRRKPAVAPDEIVGMQGIARPGGLVYVHGELWRARAAEPLRAGQPVHVDAQDGLVLRVHPV